MTQTMAETLGITMSIEQVEERADGLMRGWPTGYTHYQVKLARLEEELQFSYSQGGRPDWWIMRKDVDPSPLLAEVVSSLILDWNGSEVVYEEWCKEVQLDPEDEYNRRCFETLDTLSIGLNRLFPDMRLDDLLDLAQQELQDLYHGMKLPQYR